MFARAREDSVLRPDEPPYQYGEGCLSDQLIGQWYARMLGLGDLLDPGHVKSALAAVFRHNWKPDLSGHANPQRVYALGEEAGLLLCSWPTGGRPRFPFPYSDEVWCGIEYQVASHLIYEGFIEEGLAIVKAVRDRHTGVRRNPWNEFECGSHYARSMASYALLAALSGFSYSAPAGRFSFAPKVNAEDFACFFSVASGWGVLRQKLEGEKKSAGVEIKAGALALRELGLGFQIGGAMVSLAGKHVKATIDGAALRFAEPVTVGSGESLSVKT